MGTRRWASTTTRVCEYNDLSAAFDLTRPPMEIDKRVQSMLMPTAGPSAADLVALQAAQGHEDDDFDFVYDAEP